ncbi:MAG: hypothetical protein ABIP55_02700, partial [Tepidisphaeraceae bacterium]
MQEDSINRRQILSAACGFAGAAALAVLTRAKPQAASAAEPATTQTTQASSDPIIDIHQHTTYHGRSNEALLHHQKRLGATKTILLPGGSPVITESTLQGKANGLYAGAGPVDTCIPIARAHQGAYYF